MVKKHILANRGRSHPQDVFLSFKSSASSNRLLAVGNDGMTKLQVVLFPLFAIQKSPSLMMSIPMSISIEEGKLPINTLLSSIISLSESLTERSPKPVIWVPLSPVTGWYSIGIMPHSLLTLSLMNVQVAPVSPIALTAKPFSAVESTGKSSTCVKMDGTQNE
jgi:hypothetical protein